MKQKILSLLVLAFLLFPIISFAVPPPFVFLTIIVNTEQDAVFHYDLQGEFGDSVDIQTQNLQGIQELVFFTNPEDIYILSQNSVPGLKLNNIHCVSDNPNITFFYQPDSVVFTPQVWENIVCTFNNIKTPTKNPVLIVPGLLGTEMKKGDELLWADINRMLVDFGDEFMDPLSFNNNLLAINRDINIDDVIGKKVINLGPSKFTIYDYISGLKQEFINQSYTENQTLFTFPYDWRYGVSGVYEDGKTNVDLLAEKIDDILQQTGADKVDVVAHSLGGLIVKKYAMDNPSDNNIGKAVFVGVPNTGAPKAVKVLLQGDNFGVLGLNDAEIKKIAENMPSAYDLLPSQEYYDVKGSYITKIFVPEATDQIPPPQGTLQDLTYEETKNFLANDHNLNSLGLSKFEILHSQSFDDFDLRTSGIDLYSINGCKTATMSKITEITRENLLGNTVEYRNIKYGLGDGTIPLESATNLPIDQSNKYYALFADHGKMPSQNGIRQQIVNIISGSNLPIGTLYGQPLVTQDIAKCKLNGKAIEVFSPVDISAVDQDGNKLSLAEDGSILNEIPNSDFEIWGEHKFVYLPTDNSQTYSINLSGTDTGTYTIKVDDIQNSQTTQTEVFSNLPVTTDLAGQVVLSASAGQPTTLVLDTDGNGTTDQSVEPSSVLDAIQSDDLLPPLSTLTITGEQGEPSFYRSNAQIQISATDNNSGILAINYNIDDTGWQTAAPPAGGAAELAITDQGEHTIIYFATDRAGNNEPKKTTTFTIDTTPPETIIEFDLTTKDLKFTGADNISTKDQITIQDQGDKIALNDQAGNTTKLILPAQEASNALYPTPNTSNQIQFRIKRIRYNGNIINDSRIDMEFSWTLRKNQNIKTLVQDFEIVSETCSQTQTNQNSINTNTGGAQTCQTTSKTITADYDGTQTILTETSAAGVSAQTFNGLKIVKMTTNQGNFERGD